jgi:hypothetical protein
MELVVNEWLLEYLRPDSEKSKRDLAIGFVNAWVRKCDKILIKMPSPFVSKFYAFMKQFGWDPAFKERFKKINELLLRNPEKTIIINTEDINPLPDEIGQKVPADDKYLVELAYCSKDSTIITTDERLKEKLKGESNLKVYLLEEFVNTYLS